MFDRIKLVAATLSLGLAGATPTTAQIVGGAPPSTSPLAAYPGFGHNHNGDEAQYLREEVQRQQMIMRCMTTAGHSYVPVVPGRGATQPSERRSRRAPPRDPNYTHAASLPAQDRERYYLALYGVPDPNAEGGPLWDPRSETGGGCWGEALRTIRGVYAAASELVEPYIEMRRSVMRDPRVAAVTPKWVDCIRARGFPFSSPQDAAGAADAAAITKPRDADAQLRAQQAAGAGRTCATETGLAQAVSQARIEHEAEFVRVHKAQLDRHLARLRSQPPVP
jgi:hypothetical protein